MFIEIVFIENAELFHELCVSIQEKTVKQHIRKQTFGKKKSFLLATLHVHIDSLIY